MSSPTALQLEGIINMHACMHVHVKHARKLEVAQCMSCYCWCLQGWFDDRVEARNALAKVGKLWQISGFDRAELPWMDTGDREGRMFEPV